MPADSPAMSEAALVRAETRALKAFIHSSVEALAQEMPRRPPQEALLFLGAWQEAQPALLIQDPVLEPTDKVVWQVIKLQAHAHGASAFPSYEMIRTLANVRSDATVARAISIIRATRWLTVCARIRDARGRFRGNVYALHHEPLPLADTLHLDANYFDFLSTASTHHHARVRAVAQGVLDTIHADIDAGRDATIDSEHQSRRIAAARVVHGSAGKHDRYFSLNREALSRLQNLKTGISGDGNPTSNSKDRSPSSIFEGSKFEACSGSSSNKKTTTASKNLRPVALRFPDSLSANERYLAQRYLQTVPAPLQQRVLDVLEQRLAATSQGIEPLLYGPLPYLRALCQRAAAGTLIPPPSVSKPAEGQEPYSHGPSATGIRAPHLVRSHLVNEIRQLELMIERGGDPSGDLNRQAQRLREKLAAIPPSAQPERMNQLHDADV